ncbi:MAG: ribosome biogenesis GTPase Der [Gemmatimonadetes bacterium]|nr:ribosome biogenesis GTPase Der [Gemmatimonadota bacterium]MBI2402126.1 ribosome biogenesis GTPase Der [Gemmatimonadota bacterium]MBI2614513.1 ribosome biogenesis GTPase Der [Gemmatimonadota bacterium]
MKRATVAIVGRPNVGKSTLFNRIVGGRRAIVDHRPGVTRDRHFAPVEWGGRRFWLVDTGGWTEASGDSLEAAIRRQVELAVRDADAVLFVVDTQEGPHPADEAMAGVLRPFRDRVLLVANKADALPDDQSHHAFYRLGFGEAFPVSAAVGKGSGDLLEKLVQRLPQDREESPPDAIQVAIIGRPNVGKSSLANRLLGEERSVVAAEPGTTRDAIDSPLRYHGRTLNFIDTAGLRRRSKVVDEIEFYSSLRTERAIERADVCVLVVDASQGMHLQDLKIAEAVWEQGAGLIIAVNKWDLTPEKDTATARRGEQAVVERMPALAAVPFVYLSALTGLRVRRLPDLILSVAAERSRRIPTAEVNRVMRGLVQRNQPPQPAGREIKIYYASQIGTEPPDFAVVLNRPEAVTEAYQRFLVNGFRGAWGFLGSPVRLSLRRKRSKR